MPRAAINALIYGDDLVSPFQIGQPIDQAPFLPFDGTRYLYYVTYWQARDFYNQHVPYPSQSGPYGGYYAGTSAFRDVSAGVIEFVREYALVPATRREYESFTYSFQIWKTSSDTGKSEITEVPLTASSYVTCDYFKTDTPDTITLLNAPRFFLLDGALSTRGTFPALGQDMVAEDSTIRRWKSNIYERRTRYLVNALSGPG